MTIRMRDLYEASLPDWAKGLTVKKTGKEQEDTEEDLVTTTYYDILQKGKKVGELKHEDYFGYIDGNLFGKDIPSYLNLGDYGDNVKVALDKFLKSNKGIKWAKNLDKYKK